MPGMLGMLVLVSLLLGGCSSTQSPETGGLFETLYALQTGVYDRQLEAKRIEQNSLQAESRGHQQHIRQLDAQLANSRAQKVRLEAEIRNTGQSLQHATTRIQHLQSRRLQLRADVSELRQNTQDLDARIRAEQNQARLQQDYLGELLARRDALRQQLKTLIMAN